VKALIATGQRETAVAFADISMPRPQPGEALVKVEAFSVNRGEIFLLGDSRAGARPGKDIAGVVVQAAAHGAGPVAGQRVVGHPEAGGWAEYAAVPASARPPIPDRVPAGCIPRSAAWPTGQTPPPRSPTFTSAASAATPSSPSPRRKLP